MSELSDTAFASLPPANLRQKLASIRREIPNIEKKGTNDAQHYKFMRAEDVAGEIGDKLAECNIVLGRENLRYQFDVIEVPRDSGAPRKDMHVIVALDYIFYDGDSDERITVAAIGEGRDSGDKAVPKALTSALKYALTQPLIMRIGEDAENEAEHDRDDKPPPQRKPPLPDNQDVEKVFGPASGVGNGTGNGATHVAPDDSHQPPPRRERRGGDAISPARAKRMFAISKANGALIDEVISEWGYTDSRMVGWKDYDDICRVIEERANG